MQNWLIGKIIAVIGKKLSGYKTIGAGIGSYLMGIIGALNLLWPGTVPGVPPLDANAVMGLFVAGTYAIGRGHGNNKLIAAIQQVSNGQSTTSTATDNKADAGQSGPTMGAGS